jgi:hypothetical protein
VLTYSARCMLNFDTLLGYAFEYNSLHVRDVCALLDGCSAIADGA